MLPPRSVKLSTAAIAPSLGMLPPGHAIDMSFHTLSIACLGAALSANF